jgi:flavin prenyltransferase
MVERRMVIAITGASGAIYGIRALEILRERPEVETHLVVSDSGRATSGIAIWVRADCDD